MDLANLKNIDVNDLFNKLKSGGFGDKKLLVKFGIGFGAVLIFLIIYYVFVSPVVTAQEEKLRIMNENKEKIIEFNNNIGTLKDAVKNLEPEYEIRGNFLSYLKFRRALSKSSKVINYDKEEITTIKEIQGQILSKGTISIVGLPNEYQ